MLNRTFSVEKGREISPIEARIELFKRRLVDSLGRKRDRPMQRPLQTPLQVHSALMPKGKGKQRREDNSASETEESYVNGPGGNSRDVGNGIAEPAAASNGRKLGQNKGGNVTQQKSKDDLAQWTEYVSATLRSVKAATLAIHDLQNKLASHETDLKEIEQTKNQVTRLEKELEEKDKDIKKRSNTIEVLMNNNSAKVGETEKAKESLEKERLEFNDEKKKHESRVKVEAAELKNKSDKEFQLRITKHETEHKKKTEELEEKSAKLKKEFDDHFAKKDDEINTRVKAFEVEIAQLSMSKKNLERENKDKDGKLSKATEQCDTLERAKISVHQELQKQKKEIESMKKEFTLNSKSTEYYKDKFAEIYRVIGEISMGYFNDIEGTEDPHKLLAKADSFFEFVPIEETDTSFNLRSAHAQRIISGALCEFVWKPLSSDLTLRWPDFNTLLTGVFREVEKKSKGGRTANVWSALTMRALQTLPENFGPSQASTPGRAESVIKKVFVVLSFLVSPSQQNELRIGLLNLAQLAIDVWNEAQTGELNICVNPVLEYDLYDEWRSPTFDPPPPPGDGNGAKSSTLSQAPPLIFTLFPRVVARKVVDQPNDDTALPGSYPSEPVKTYHIVETCIHPGVGLPESSPLVLTGKTEQQEINKAYESLRKEFHTKRLSGKGRRESTASSISGPLSPSSLWKTGGTVDFPES